ncbi:MAG TPA: pilus assembly protein PilC [Verrucomicrobia bacterium]|nr:pilus assembly protein PilC [Verrucomicrobiota bacterium]
MARFRYIAMDGKGAEVEGVIEAGSQNQAVSAIRTQGLFPTRVAEVGGAAKSGKPAAGGARKATPAPKSNKGLALPAFLKPRVKQKQLMVFTRQLATLIEAGLPLLRGLRILLKQEKTPGLREALVGMGEAVESGGTFSEALAAYPRTFDKLYINMVKAGEAGGLLDTVLVRLAEFMEKSERIKGKVKSAMTYPIVVLVAAMGILGFLMVFIIPKFAEIFQGLSGGKGLPPLTQFVINISDTVAQRWWLILGLGFGAVALFKALKKTPRGALLLDRVSLKAPMFGSLFRKTAVARFARTLGTLMSSGVPILQALMIVRDTAGNQVISNAIQSIHDSVKEGESVAMPMEASGVFPGMVVSMVDVGEETGALPEMLVRVANGYDEEVDMAVEGLTSIIEPIMIVVLALIIGTIVIAMFVPLISIISEMSA